MSINASVQIDVLDKRGNKIRSVTRTMQSFLKNFVYWKLAEWQQQNPPGLIDTGNTSRTLAYPNQFALNAAAAIDTYGIVCGTGVGAIAQTDYNMGTKIAHGNAANQLYHQAQIFNAVIVSGLDAYFTLQRNFNNNSGGSITIQEVGIVAMFTGGGSYKLLIVRDLTGGTLVEHTKTAVVTYTFMCTA